MVPLVLQRLAALFEHQTTSESPRICSIVVSMAHRRKEDSHSDGPPLMDELNELIEKERTLLNLKLLAQKTETDSWKTKYDQLLDKVGTGSYDNLASAGQTLESAAEVEMEGSHGSEVTFHDVQQILVKRVASWILDLNGVVMDKMLFAKLGKEVFGPRSSFDAINTLNVSRCSITDEFVAPLMAIMRTSRLQAIDLSHNELSELFFLQMLETLKNVRRTPQYVLLEGNAPLSASAKHFDAILEALTEHTWGLTVSLMDFTDLALAAPHKSSKAARREPNFDYKETVKQPMLVYEFLKAFNQKLDPALSKSVSAAKKVAAASKAILLGRQNGLHRVTAFGLKYCHISKKSVGLLEATLKHVASSLTDLDLSFAYIGYPGAEMLRNVLSAEGCQLIRLGLIGNAMGDAGISTMSKSLQAHPTLTYIDLRSNDISNTGLTALATPLMGNCVLSLLDLRGNAVGQEAALALAQQLSDAGSHLHVRWDNLDVDPHSRAEKLTADPIYSFPHQVKTVGAVGRATKLYSIDLTTVHLNHPERYGQPLALEWKWRPTPIGSFGTAGALLDHGNHGDHAQRASDGASEAKDSTLNTTKSSTRTAQSRSKGGKGPAVAVDTDDNSHYFRVGSSYSATWEVRVVYNHQELFVQRQAIDASSAVTRKVLERFPGWVSSSLILQDLPLKATIEVLVTCVDASVDASDAYAQRARTKHFIGFQGVDLHLSPVPARDSYRIGGDDPSFSPEVNSLLGRCDDQVTRALQQQHPALRNMLILRRLRCASKGKGLDHTVLSWSAKLTSSFTGFKGAAPASKRAPGSEEMPPNHLTLGYSWAVHVLSAEGGQRIAAEGICVGGLEGDTTGPGAGAGAADDSKLRAWIWRDCAAAIFDLREDDWVLLVGKPISQQPNYPAAALASCAIGVKDCELSVTLADAAKGPHAAQHGDVDLHHGDEQHHAPPTLEAAGVVCDGAASLLYAWHDDPRMQLPF